VDAERVLQFLVNKLQVRGQIGVYGRSIGGIAASHLVHKFPNHIRAFIGDRTLGTLDSMVLKRYRGGHHFFNIFKMLTCWLKLNNGPREFVENRNCYKIHCFDQDDDIVDIFSSHHHEIAKSYSRINYDTDDWKKFYESLQFVFEIERELHFSEIIHGSQEDMK